MINPLTIPAMSGSLELYNRAVTAPIDLPHRPILLTPPMLRKC